MFVVDAARAPVHARWVTVDSVPELSLGTQTPPAMSVGSFPEYTMPLYCSIDYRAKLEMQCARQVHTSIPVYPYCTALEAVRSRSPGPVSWYR